MNKLACNNLIAKIKWDDRLFTRVLTFIPPVLGIIIFSYIVKFSKIDSVVVRLPLYQGLMSFYSLISMGFMYVRNRSAIAGKKMYFFLSLIFLFPIIVYSYKGIDFKILLVLSLIFLINSCIMYLLLLKVKVIYYLFYSAINSILLPITLSLNLAYLSVLSVLFFFVFFYTFKSVKKELEEFKFSENGLDIVKSILIHSPFLIFPFFDYKIQEIVGLIVYSNYVLLNKYINGLITIMFSYAQLNLIFSRDLKKTRSIKLLLITITFLMLVIAWVNNYVVFGFLLFLYSLGVNLSSLLMRNELMKGISLKKSLIGLFFVCIYIFSINIFQRAIYLNNNLFVVLMFLLIVITCFLVILNTTKKYNNG